MNNILVHLFCLSASIVLHAADKQSDDFAHRIADYSTASLQAKHEQLQKKEQHARLGAYVCGALTAIGGAAALVCACKGNQAPVDMLLCGSMCSAFRWMQYGEQEGKAKHKQTVINEVLSQKT